MADAPPLSPVRRAVALDSATGAVLIYGQLDELPRLPAGKIRKSELRAQHGTWSGRVTAEADR